MTEDAHRRLRAHFFQHNRRVVAFAVVTALGALAFWALLYLVMYWLVLLTLTIATQRDTPVPPYFSNIFFASAFVLCGLGWLAHRLSPNEMPRDKKSALEVALDFILFVPRITLAVWGNLRALQFLSEHELQSAQRLLETVAREERLSVYQVPLEIPEERMRLKVLLALQITGLIEVRKRQEEMTLVLTGDMARALTQSLARLRVR